MSWPVAVALLAAAPAVDLAAAAGRLAHPSFPVREAATWALRAGGSRSAGPLAAAAASPDPEVRRRAVALQDALEADRLDTPTLVDVVAANRPADEVAAELARQSGYPVGFNSSGGPVPGVTLDRRRVPFWAAVDAVCEAAGLAAGGPADGRLELAPADSTDPFVCYAGPFRLTATGVSGGQHKQLAGVPRRGLPPAGPEPLHLSFALTAEPKAPVVGVGAAAVLAADDDRGLTLRPPADADRTSYSPAEVGHKGLVHGFNLTLQRRDKGAARVRTLKGTVPVAVLAASTPDVVVPDPVGSKGKPVRGRTATVTVTGAAEADGLLTLDVVAARTGPGPVPDGWHAGVPQRLELFGADGTAWPFAGVATQTVGPDATTAAVQFRPPAAGAKPARLTLVEWRTVAREVAFEFRDLPLP